ncbi:MAG: hypothetical protein AAB955_03975 [Patescibacteria group bacterium]
MKTLLTIAVLGAVIILGGVYLFLQPQAAAVIDTITEAVTPAPKTEAEKTGATESTPTAAVPDKGTGTLRTVLSKGGNYTCTLEFAEAKEKSSATIYGAAGKIRQDFRQTDNADGTFTDTHVIKTGGVVYTWVDGNVVGLKSYSTGPVLPSVSGVGFSTTADATVSWNCHAWLPDQKLFTLPKEISFVDE